MPAAVNRWTVLSSPPMMPVAGETSLATIQSAFLRARLAAALVAEVVGFGGEADDQARDGAVPGRRSWPGCRGWAPGPALGGGAPGAFLILPVAAVATRQSATAAAQHGDIGRQRGRQASSICRAVSTRIDGDAGGSGSATGPLTRVTRAPRAASAAAIAWPCRPLLRLAR